MLLNSLIFLENITTKCYPWVKCALPQLWWVEWILKVGNLQLKSRVMAVSFFLGTRMSTAWSAAHSFSVLFTLDSQPNPAQAFKHFTWYFSNNFEWRSAFQLFHLSLPLKRNSMRDWPFEARPFLKTTGTLYMLVHDAKTITRQCMLIWIDGNDLKGYILSTQSHIAAWYPVQQQICLRKFEWVCTTWILMFSSA